MRRIGMLGSFGLAAAMAAVMAAPASLPHDVKLLDGTTDYRPGKGRRKPKGKAHTKSAVQKRRKALNAAKRRHA